MISLKRRSITKTPLQDGLYVYCKNEMFQIRVKDTHEVITAVLTKEEMLICAKTLVDRYETVERLRSKLAECEYLYKMNAEDKSKREQEYSLSKLSALQKEFMDAFSNTMESEVKVNPPVKRRSILKIKLA